MQHRQWPLGRKAPYYYGMVGGLSIVIIGFSDINSVSCEGSVVAWGGVWGARSGLGLLGT